MEIFYPIHGVLSFRGELSVDDTLLEVLNFTKVVLIFVYKLVVLFAMESHIIKSVVAL